MFDSSFSHLVSQRSGENISRCYYCQKCTAGCPTAYAMDYKPAQVLKLIQLGMKDELLASSAIWLCVSCETCGTRCPNEIDIAHVMDALRHLAVEEGYAPAEKEIFALHESFLNNIRTFGRVHEATMLAGYMLKSWALFSDLDLGAKLFLKGKIPLLPARVRRLQEIRRMFKEAEEL